MLARCIALAALLNSDPPPRAAAAAPAPLILAQEEADLDHDGSPDTISIEMIAGEIKPGGCAGGGYLWTGRFVVTVSLAKGLSVSTYLNPLFRVEDDLTFFAPPWTLVIADYKHDGQPGFNLAEWGCQNNTAYHLFAIRPDGVVEALCVAGGYAVGVYGDEPSTADIKLTEDGFEIGQYDNSVAAGCRLIFRWNRGRAQFDLTDQKCTPIQ